MRPFPGRLLLAFGLSLVLCGLVSCSNAVSTAVPATPAPTAASQWVVAWGTPPQNAIFNSTTDPGGSEQSFRFFFVPTVSGTQERVHFSNLYTGGPVTIGAARLSVAAGGASAGMTPAIDPSHDAALTFNGSTSVTLASGQEIVSDPVNVTYTYGQKLAVSLFLQGTFPSLTQHDSQVNTNFATPVGAGNTTTDSAGSSFSQSNTEWYMLTGVDVYGPYDGTVAIFGSSSVDGHASNYGDTFPTQQPMSPSQGRMQIVPRTGWPGT